MNHANALGLAYRWQQLLDEQQMTTLAEIADAERTDITQVDQLSLPPLISKLKGSG